MMCGVSVVVIAANVEPWQGMIAVVTLAGVVGYLFKWADGRISRSEAAKAALELAHAAELGRRDQREAQIRAECEARLALLAKQYADALRQEHLDNRAHEDDVRKEFVGVVALIGDQTSKSAESLTEVLGKLHDRFAGPRSP